MKITMSTLGTNGRLGNQLFQISGMMGLGEKHGAQVFFPPWEYEEYFETPLPHGEMAAREVQERFFHHHDWQIDGNSDIRGYLQSEKYFGSFRLKLKKEIVDECKSRMDIFERETICIQVRRGDYVGNPNYYQIPITFYIHALAEYFPNWRDFNILVISDDMEYCKIHFGSLPNVFFSEESTAIRDLALASACDHFIISSSTFGWWCAWLGEKKHSKIIHCGKLFSGKLTRKDSRDFFPARWIEHKRDTYKIPLRDMTFTVPVFYDHPDRKNNLDLSLYLLLSAFDTSVIVCEQGGNTFAYTGEWATYIPFQADHFHRTKMLNLMAGEAKTEFISNWDCDVIIPPAQIWAAVEELRAGADMVFPYGGGFARMPRQWFPRIEEAFDIGVVKGASFKNMDDDHNSVGGAVFFNRQSFIDGGMENENFISFGPEDCERHDRFKMLGYDIRRVRRPLYHLNHYVGRDSSPANPHFARNQAEYEKVHAMGREDLRKYIDTWKWRHPYTETYYGQISEGAIRSARIVMAALSFEPATVIDIGCGVGEWNNGNPGYFGIDHRIDVTKLLIPADRYIDCDLNHDVPNMQGRKFDLCICLEVAEHLKPNRARALIEFLCSLSDRVLFSAAIPYQGGTGHINEQWMSFWAELFAENGFGSDPKQPDIRNNPDVELWYRQNTILYSRGAKGIVTDFVLPDYYIQIVGHLRKNETNKAG